MVQVTVLCGPLFYSIFLDQIQTGSERPEADCCERKTGVDMGRMGLAVAKLKVREDAEPLTALPALGARPLPTAGLSNLW